MKQFITKLRERFSPKAKGPPVLGVRRSYRPKIDFVAIAKNPIFQNSLMIIACAYFVADFVATAIRPLIPEIKAPRSITSSTYKRRQLADYDVILSRNLFNEKGLIPNTDDMNTGFGPPVRSSLPLNLTGIITVQDELKSVASVEDKGSNQVMAVRVNDYVNPEVLVQKIESNKMIFFNKSSGRREFIELPEDQIGPTIRRKAPTATGGGISKDSDTHFTIEKTFLDKTLADMSKVVQQARCVPNFENGKPDGYRCFQIEAGSIYQKLGLEENDVICGLNGEPLNDPAQAFAVFNKLKEMTSLDICIKRNGRISNKTYDFR